MIGTTRVPAWVEAGNKNVFVDTARLLELELERGTAKTEAKIAGSVLIVDESLEAELKVIPGVAPKVLSGEGKHGRTYTGYSVTLSGSLH